MTYPKHAVLRFQNEVRECELVDGMYEHVLNRNFRISPDDSRIQRISEIRELRCRRAGDLNTLIFDIPVSYRGTHQECCAWAKKHGYESRRDPDLLFGVYFANAEGDCLYLT